MKFLEGYRWMSILFIVSVIYLSISLTSCSTLDNYTVEERRASWYKSCVETSSLPDTAEETCHWRADKIIFVE